MNAAKTARAQRISLLVQQYNTGAALVKAIGRDDMELLCTLLAARCILRAQYPQDNANRTEPTYPWNINEGGAS